MLLLFLASGDDDDGDDTEDGKCEGNEKIEDKTHMDYDTALLERTNNNDETVNEEKHHALAVAKADGKKAYSSEKENEMSKLDTNVQKTNGVNDEDICNEENLSTELKMSIGDTALNDTKNEIMEEDTKDKENAEVDKSTLCNGKDTFSEESSTFTDETASAVKSEEECNDLKDKVDKVKTEKKDCNWMFSLKKSHQNSEKSKERPETPPLQKLMRQDFSHLKSESAFSPSPPKKVKEGFTSKLASVIVPPSPIIPRAASHPKQLLSHNISNLRNNLKSMTNQRNFRPSQSNRVSPYPSMKSFIQSDEQPLDLSKKSKVHENSHVSKSRLSSDARHKSSHLHKHGNGFSSPVSTSLQSLQQKFGGDFHLRGLQKPTNYMLYGPEIPALHRALLHTATLSLPHMAISMSNDIPKRSRFEHSPVQKHRNTTPSPSKSKHEELSKSIKSERCASPEKSSKVEKVDSNDRLDDASPGSEDCDSKTDKYTNHMCTCGKWFNNLYALSLHLQETGHLPARSKAVSLLEYPKLVRGQDMWLNQESEQTRRILRCIQCGESFKTLPMLTVHMMKTQHYTKIVSSEHARRTHKCSAYCDREPDKECVFKCKVCQDTFTDMEGLANHMIMSGHHKKQVVRPNPSLTDMGLRSKRKRYYGFEDINPYHPTVAALLDYKRKCMGDRASPDYSVDNDSDESESTITCESCGRRIGTKLFVEHVRACIGMKLSEEDYIKKEGNDNKSEKEITSGISAKFAILEKLCKMDADFDSEEDRPALHTQETTPKSKTSVEWDQRFATSGKEFNKPKVNGDSKVYEKNQLIKKLFEEDASDAPASTNPEKENFSKSTIGSSSSPVKEIQNCENKTLSSPVHVPSVSPPKSNETSVKTEAKETAEKTSVPSIKLTNADTKPCHVSKKLDIIDPDHMKEEMSGKSALSAMESFIQKSFSNKFDYKKGNIVISPNSTDISIHSKAFDSSLIPETSLDYINKYKKFYTALTSQNGYNDAMYNPLKEAGTTSLNGDVGKTSADGKEVISKDKVLSPMSNNADKDDASSVQSHHSENSVDKNETLEKKYLDVSDCEDTKSEKAKSSALDNLSSFVYGQPMTSEHPLDSLQRLITKTDIPKLMASAGAKTFKYLPPHLQLQATGELPVPLNLSLKSQTDESDDDDQLRLDEENLSDCDGAGSPSNSDSEPVEYRCAACSRRFASKGSYRYHLSRCHLSSVKRYGIKEAFNMSPYVYLPLDHTARFSKYYEMAKELANKRKQQ